MNKEMICKNCKYHYIEEISFDYPQSCCSKRMATTEGWCKCNDFEYSDRYIKQLQQENKVLRENAENNDRVVDKTNWENQLLKKENKQLKDLIDAILNFSFFKEECPLNFGFENNTNEDKSQSIFYEDEWCENNCNDNYKDCWLKYFKKLQELEGSDSNVKNKR